MATQIAVALLRGPFAKQYLPLSDSGIEDLTRDARKMVNALMEGLEEDASK